MKRIAFAVFAWLLSLSAQAGIVVTLSDDGSGGVIASIAGAGTSIDANFVAIAGFQEVGNYTSVPQTQFPLASPITIGLGVSIVAITIDDDTTAELTQDDLSLLLSRPLAEGLPYAIDGSSQVPGLHFSSLFPGTYAGATPASTIGPFDQLTLNIAAPTTPEGLLEQLITTVVGLNLHAGIGNALDSKLQNALDALDRAQAGNAASAIGIMYAFIQSVEAQRGKKLSDAQADELVAAAEAVIAALDPT